MMNLTEFKEYVRLLLEQYSAVNKVDWAKLKSINARTVSLIEAIDGKKSIFSEILVRDQSSFGEQLALAKEILVSFVQHVESGVNGSESFKRQAEIDVISDFLDQALQLLNNKSIHPAAPAVLIGATLEEYLRTWIESEELDMSGKISSIDGYAKALREANLISKQDIKDLTAWTGIRNSAAHGNWSELGDSTRIRLMLEGVNLFMRRYPKQ